MSRTQKAGDRDSTCVWGETPEVEVVTAARQRGCVRPLTCPLKDRNPCCAFFTPQKRRRMGNRQEFHLFISYKKNCPGPIAGPFWVM